MVPLQGSCASGRMPACLIPVRTEVPASPWPTSSPACAPPASRDRSVRQMSTSATFQASASTVAPASTCRVPISASAPRASRASAATAPTCPVHPPPASTAAPAGRRATSLLSATASQVRGPPAVLGVGAPRGSCRKCPSQQGKGEVRLCWEAGCWWRWGFAAPVGSPAEQRVIERVRVSGEESADCPVWTVTKPEE